jgi:hypothetical protein
MKPDVATQFFKNTDDTGRFVYVSQRTGKTYAVEPIINGHTPAWGSVDPATKKLVNKPGAGKYRGGIDADESLITEQNGFINIQVLDVGVSPLAALDYIDAKYPDKV